MDVAADVQKAAKAIGQAAADENNCKQMSRVIQFFPLDQVFPKLKDLIEQMHQYFVTAYKGFFCTLCDAQAHQYFSLNKKSVQFSLKFCRSLVQNTLNVAMYNHVHLVRLVNLMVTFVSSCNSKGAYLAPEDDLAQY